MDVLQAPTKPCHNCRRRRLRCDRSVPSCHKCTSAGHECLGYGKLFRWADGVATRGKLAGNKTPAKSSYPIRRRHEPPGQSTSPPGELTDDWSLRPQDDLAYSEADAQLVRVSTKASPLDWGGDDDPGPATPTPWVLVDPVFQDVEYRYRHYFSYFTDRVCKDLVAYDTPDRNPFRRLIPLTQAHPLLQHVIVAASAAHMSNLIKPPLAPAAFNCRKMTYPGSGEASRRALMDSLVAKQKALHLLYSAVQDIDSVGSDVVLAAVLFFINVELIESGKYGWKAHLEGAGRIMTFLQPGDSSNDSLRDYIMSDCFIYYILASAFMSHSPAPSSYFQFAQITYTLERTASNSYLCCPSDVLQILLEAAHLSNTTDDEAECAAEGARLINRAQALDINEWANKATTVPYVNDDTGASLPQSRLHAGGAHRTASCLYILQAIPSVRALLPPDTEEELERDLTGHLCLVPDDDPNFKSTTWPTFIAGAQTRDPERQAWIVDRFERLLRACPWGFITTAMQSLDSIWSLEREGKGQRGWVQTLKDPDMNFLMV